MPFGDLSVSDDASDASVAAFFWDSVGVGGRWWRWRLVWLWRSVWPCLCFGDGVVSVSLVSCLWFFFFFSDVDLYIYFLDLLGLIY